MTRFAFGSRILFALVILVFVKNFSFGQTQKDLVNGNLIQFNDNGAWCWFQDERAVIDIANSKLIVGSAASGSGSGGSPRNADLDVVFFDLQNGLLQRSTIMKNGGGALGCDDHNAPAILVRPDNKYLAVYAGHNNNKLSYYRVYDAGTWGAQQTFDWNARIPGGASTLASYSNVYYLSTEGRMYNFCRIKNTSPHMMVSTDSGNTWSYGGQLTWGPSTSYNNGYYKYWSNGVDRIDFLFTEAHPRDTLTSIYHGYIKNGQSFKSDGVLVDTNIFDNSYIPTFRSFTKVFSNGTLIGSDTMNRCWQADFVRYNDGNITAIITARINQSYSPGYPDNNINPPHAFIYCRYNGISWSYTYLGKAGYKMYPSEGDYTGLGAVCPNDPNTIYISTSFDPRDDSNLTVREIFKGVTSDNGASWTWTPITQNSVRNNFRPIVPAWNNNNTALLWWRGTYSTAQIFDAAVVGILDRKSETIGKKSYVDATTSNTTLADGSPLTYTGPDTNASASDGLWQIRTGRGNGGTVLTSAELAAGENAPAIKTQINLPDAGTYDVWVNFWGVPTTTADWRIKAGLSADNMQVFRSMACKEVDSVDYTTAPLRVGADNTFLYQAYLGRVSGVRSFNVIVDDSAYRVGTTTPLRGDVNRTWYDGVSYASVNVTVGVTENKVTPTRFNLEQNYPNPFNPTTKILYSISKSNFVTLKIYDVLGREIQILVNKFQEPNKYSIDFNADRLASGVYFYQLKAGNGFSEIKKMILMK